MKYLYFCIFIINFSFSKEIFQSIRLLKPSLEKIEKISKLGIPLDHSTGKKGFYIDFIASSDQVSKLRYLDIDVEILIPDLTLHYKSRNTPENERDFPLGSMQGNYTLAELNNRFDELKTLYPDFISEKLILGQSYEGRDIWAFKVSDNPNINEDEPQVLFTGLTHAREPLSMMNLFYFVQKLLEHNESDLESNFIINNRELWFIPVINPDGYAYNEFIEPNGGGMHRKNRFDNGCGDGTGRGVDLNRNYGYGWGSNNTGSSPDECSDIYRGESAFSEIETQLIRDFILDNQFKNILHYHSYSNVYIHAFGDGSLPNEPELTTLIDVGNEMAKYNGYSVGTGSEVIGYSVNGDAVDWTFGEQGIISFTPEIGTSNQGFWPSENEIIDLCEDQFYSNKIFAFTAGADVILKSYNLSENMILEGEDEVEVEILIENRGLSEISSDLNISFSPLNTWINIITESVVYEELQARSSESFTVVFSTNESSPQGISSGIVLNIDSENSFSRADTIYFTIGESEVIFSENFEQDLDGWILDENWGLSNEASNGQYSLSDSPGTEYAPNQISIAEINRDFNLSFFSDTQVKFKLKWDIELNYDFVRFQGYSPVEGWISLEGRFTSNGSGNPAQPGGEPGYDGLQETWVDEVIYLNQESQVTFERFRFIQTSDQFVEGAGFFVDNIIILGYPQGQLGDFNLDDKVDIFDLLLLSDLLLFGSTPNTIQLFYCDLDGNGYLDIMDIILLTNKILNF